MNDRDELELRISAFLDGVMEPQDLRAFEAQIEADPALAARVEQMLGNDALLQEAFSAPIEQGVDDALLERMGLAPALPQVIDLSARRAAKTGSAANDNAGGWTRWRIPLGGALAAGLALALMLDTRSSSEQGGFAAAMETLPSGQVASLDDGISVKPLLTFRAGDGRYCREFSLGSGGGIACRESGGGKWRVEALDAAATSLGEAGEIELAAGADGSGLDAAYARLDASDPLGQTAEAALISGKWQK